MIAKPNKSLQLTQKYAVSLRCSLYFGSTEFKRYIVYSIKSILRLKAKSICLYNLFRLSGASIKSATTKGSDKQAASAIMVPAK
jgi:hypothetical protein